MELKIFEQFNELLKNPPKMKWYISPWGLRVQTHTKKSDYKDYRYNIFQDQQQE